MAAHEYYDPSTPAHRRLNAPLPPVPSQEAGLKPPKDPSTVAVSPISSSLQDDQGYTPFTDRSQNSSYFDLPKQKHHAQDPFGDHAAIPLEPQYPKHEQYGLFPHQDIHRQRAVADLEGRRPYKSDRKKKKKKRRFTKKSPWFIYTITLIQITVFIAEVIRNGVLTGTPIEIHPSFNPMIGPSPYVLINMGARYVPCMRNQDGVQNAHNPVFWPCPNQTTTVATCSLPDLCGFSGVPLPHIDGSLDETPAPNQWFRFIVPIFLHAGIIHIGFNMLLQVLLGGDMERAIGPVRVALVYFPSGIFGFVLGGNFAPPGIASTGASGCIFGLIALTLLDLLYTWHQRRHPVRDLCWILLDIVISFVLGLLPGVDNFSHIGGFLMGLVLGVCLLRSPNKLRQRINGDDTNMPYGSDSARDSRVGLVQRDQSSGPEYGRHSPSRSADPAARRKTILSSPTSADAFRSPRTFFSGRRPLWWAWWLIRVVALVGVVAAFIALVKAFYHYHDTECEWCRYLSCLPIDNWCDIGDLTFSKTPSSGPGS